MKLNSVLKQKFLRVAAGVALVAGLLPATNAFAFPTSGTCTMLVTQPVPYGQAIPATNVSYNIFAILTFTSATTGTIDYDNVRLDYTANGIANVTENGPGSPIPFTVASVGPSGPAEGRKIAFTSNGATININAMAVNGGNTIIMQGTSAPFSGVCQF